MNEGGRELVLKLAGRHQLLAEARVAQHIPSLLRVGILGIVSFSNVLQVGSVDVTFGCGESDRRPEEDSELPESMKEELLMSNYR